VDFYQLKAQLRRMSAEGGQAIVGNVAHGGRGSPEKMEPSS